MYQALYRKYRPSNLNEVVGQKVVVQTLKNAILNNKISHAYLFTGPRGTGKTSIAKILAKTINCTNLNEFIPCEKCDSCVQIANRQNTDIIEIDAASNNGVDEIRELRNKITLVPSYSKYKVYIIDEVHMLTQGAFNALLKTLEEPPGHIIFILATTEPHKIPVTILSRCQRFDFKKISKGDIKERLKYISKQENIKIEDEALTEISRLSDGGMRDSISMLDQASSYTNETITTSDVHDINGTVTQEKLNEIIKLIIKKDIKDVLDKIEYYDEEGKNLVKLTEEIIFYLKNILVYDQTNEVTEQKEELIEQYKEILKTIKIKEIMKMIKLLNGGLSEMKKSINPKINLELIILELLIDETEIPKIENQEQNVNKNISNNKENIENIANNENKVNVENKENKENIASNENIVNKENMESNENIENKTNKIKQQKENQELKDKLEKIKQIRINNTLSKLKKQNIKIVQTKLEQIRSLSLDPTYCEITSYIFDGIIKAASDKNLIFVFDDKGTSDSFNEKVIEIEKLFKEKLEIDYKIISTYKTEWEKIKNEFNSKTKTYQYIEEPFEINEILIKKEDNNEIESLFEEVIEYK